MSILKYFVGPPLEAIENLLVDADQWRPLLDPFTVLQGAITTRPRHYGGVINYINSQPLSGFIPFDWLVGFTWTIGSAIKLTFYINSKLLVHTHLGSTVYCVRLLIN